MLKQTLAGLRILLVMTVILGVLYPLGVWVVSRIPGLEANAEGSIINTAGQPVGSALIGIDPQAKDSNNDPYFHNRPSAMAKDPLGQADLSNPSQASNKASDNADYLAVVQQRKDAIAKREGVDPAQVPVDAVTASASGLDPQISPAYAELQVPRVSRVTGVSQQRLRELVADNTTGRGLGVLGDPGVNVLRLNLAVRAEKH